MAETVTMPKLGFDMAEGTLVRWVKAEGETVNKGDVLAEIETDKATVEVESPFSGVIYRHLVEAGRSFRLAHPLPSLRLRVKKWPMKRCPTGKAVGNRKCCCGRPAAAPSRRHLL